MTKTLDQVSLGIFVDEQLRKDTARVLSEIEKTLAEGVVQHRRIYRIPVDTHGHHGFQVVYRFGGNRTFGDDKYLYQRVVTAKFMAMADDADLSISYKQTCVCNRHTRRHDLVSEQQLLVGQFNLDMEDSLRKVAGFAAKHKEDELTP